MKILQHKIYKNIALLFSCAIFFMLISKLNNTHQEPVDYLKSDITELSRVVAAMQQTVGDKLERSGVAMQTSIQKQLSESSRLVSEVSQRLARLDETNRKVVDVTAELKTLQNILQNPKQRGVFGEYYLKNVLENVLPPGRFQMQYKFKDGEVVDAVIFLEKGRVLPIDSKFSLENYNRIVETRDPAEKSRLIALLKSDLKTRIDETSKYIRSNEKTMDFAFMFIPSEALYYDLLVNKIGTTTTASRDLIEYAFRDKNVVIVSPTSFMAYLQTVMQGLRSLQIEEQAKEIQIRVGQLGRHISSFEAYMQKLGGSLSTTVNHFNSAHKELKKIDKDVVKIADSSPGVEPLQLDRPRVDDN